jgi:hypothetical protein
MSVRWPKPYEWATLALSAGALAASIGSWSVARKSLEVASESAAAQQENLKIECGEADRIDSVFPSKAAEQPAAIGVHWIAAIINNSRSPVNVRTISVTLTSWLLGGDDLSGPKDANDKRGADRSLNERNFSIDPAKSTTVRLYEEIPISAKAAAVVGAAKPKSVTEANNVLRSAGIDIFGNARHKDGSLSSTDPEIPPPSITISIETSRGRFFDGRCQLAWPYSRLTWVDETK